MTNRTTLGRIWAEAGQRVDPDANGSKKYRLGWLAEIPSYEVLNYLQWRIDIALTALAERGIPEWGNDIGYVLGALVWDNTNNTVYRAKVNAPSRGLAPSANLSQWEPSAIQISSLQWTTANNKIDTHIARKDNPHGVTAEQVNTYIKSVIDSKIATVNTTIPTTRAALTTHITSLRHKQGLFRLLAGRTLGRSPSLLKRPRSTQQLAIKPSSVTLRWLGFGQVQHDSGFGKVTVDWFVPKAP